MEEDGKKKDNGNNEKIVHLLFSFDNFNNQYEKSIKEIKTLKINVIDKLLLIKAYNKIFIESIISGIPINFIQTLNIEKEKSYHAYVRAIEFIRNIIENLEEKSRLFEIFLYLDSDEIENMLINNEEKIDNINNRLGLGKIIEQKKSPTEFGLNMLNINEVRADLLNLLPKYIIRINTNMKFIATYDKYSKIMFLNEFQLFKSDSIYLTYIFESDDDLNIGYVLPLVMEILHELYGHGKMRFINDKAKTPEEYRDSKTNFCRNSLKRIIDKNKVIKYSESGVVLEHFISQNRTIIKWLKTVQDILYTKQVMDVNMWVDKDFNKLESLVANFIGENNNQYENKSLYTVQTYSNDEDFIIDSDDDMCGFHKFDN